MHAMKVTFYKYHGTGNDFIILDNYHEALPELSAAQIKKMCDRHFGIGADGLMYLNKKEGYDFEMKYYNSDGNESTMCGNGGRCLVKFASEHGFNQNNFKFMAIDGEHEAESDLNENIRLKMKAVDEVEYHNGYALLNTGSPHFVKLINNVNEVDVIESGREIRYNHLFEKEGINVNFVENIKTDTILVRTYERGVEDETLSCGTGVTAAALISAHNDNGFNMVMVKTPGGNLRVEFDKISDQEFNNIWLCGPAIFVFKGEIEL